MESHCFGQSHRLGAGNPSSDPQFGTLVTVVALPGAKQRGCSLGQEKVSCWKAWSAGAESPSANSSDNEDDFYYPQEDALSR